MQAFARGLQRGLEQFLWPDGPAPALSPWRQVLAALPEAGQRLTQAVQSDNH